MRRHVILGLAVLAVSGGAFGQIVNTGPFLDAYQVNYAANLNIGDSSVVLTNTGLQGPFFSDPVTYGNICVNVYTALSRNSTERPFYAAFLTC